MAQGDSPLQTWVSGWVEFLTTTGKWIFLAVVILAGLVILVRKGDSEKGILGGIRGAIAFGLGAAVVYLLLTNVVGLADLFEAELPLGD